MKNQQQQAARDLYFSSNLSKTEIAEQLSVSRRSIYQWSVDGDWEKLRLSARHMPAILAEKVYYLIGHLTDHLLGAETHDFAITKEEVNMLHKLTITAAKLKKGSTVADNMETFTYFLERIHRQDPKLAAAVAPHVEDYITVRRGKDESSFLLHGFDQTGHLPYSEKEEEEKRLDGKEEEAIQAEKNPQSPQQTTQQPKNHTAASSPSNPVLAQSPSPARPYEPVRPVHTPLHASPSTPPIRSREAQAA